MRSLALVAVVFAAACGPERYRPAAGSQGGVGGGGGAGGDVDPDADGAGGAEVGDRDGGDDAPAGDGPGGDGTGTGGDGADGGGADGGALCPGGAVQFDGSDDVLTVARQVQDDFTIEGWIRTTVPSLTGTRFFHGSGLFYADVMGNANDFAVAVLNNKLVFAVGDTSLVQSTSDVVFTTPQWVHVAVFRVRLSGTIGMVINGTQEAVMASPMTLSLTAPVSITFGGNTVDRRFFNGAVDELRIWNVARTAAEIRSTMNRTLTGTEAGLVGYWRFDEAAGAVFADSSPSHNNATAVGVATPAHVVSDAPICP